MTPPSPITRIVQMLSALLGGVWAKLVLGRRQAAELREVMEGLKAFEALFASWKAGTLVVPPPLEGEGRQVQADSVAAVEREAAARPRARSPRAPRERAPRNQAPEAPEARRRIIRTRPVNWAVIPRRLGPSGKRRRATVPRADEWSG